jgi:hypothetical protein
VLLHHATACASGTILGCGSRGTAYCRKTPSLLDSIGLRTQLIEVGMKRAAFRFVAGADNTNGQVHCQMENHRFCVVLRVRAWLAAGRTTIDLRLGFDGRLGRPRTSPDFALSEHALDCSGCATSASSDNPPRHSR